jgi:site-specific recombinase XerD
MRPDLAVTEFLYAHEYAEKSRTWYIGMLGRFAEYCAKQGIGDIGEVSAPLVRRFFDEVRQRRDPRTGQLVSSQTVHGYARAVRALLNWCVAEGLLGEGVPRRVAMPRREQKVLHTLDAQQIDRLMRVAQTVRDKAVVALLIDTGLRANELCTLTLENLHFSANDAWLLVKGKRDKWREVGLGNRARQLLHRYIHRERPQAAPSVRQGEQHVFLGRRGPLTPSGLDQLLYTLRDTAGCDHFAGVRVSAHTFRHSYAVAYLANGGDVYKLSRLLGHTSVSVTENYLRAFSARAARQGVSVFDTLAKLA